MQITNLTKSAFTLLEVLLASVIFVISVAGVFATLSAVRQPVLQKERSLTAAVFGQQELEILRSQVNANNIDPATGNYIAGNPLAVGSHALAPVFDQNGTKYTISYTVSCAVAGCPAGGAMMVNLTVTFPDA
jgi:Tfp pilus assembly protein PilV